MKPEAWIAVSERPEPRSLLLLPKNLLSKHLPIQGVTPTAGSWLGAIMATVGGFALGWATLLPTSVIAADASPDFTREVRPILAKHCFKCHGPDDLTRKGGLRLDVRSAALQPSKSGAVALIPGNLEKSELVRRITTSDVDEVMPPPATKMALMDPEKDILKRWVAAGAEYQDHWSFVRPIQKELPPVSNPAWIQNGIDRFILSRLDREGVAPAAQADPQTWIRRVYLDLIGLPPTPEEADAFVQDVSPGSYERVVDRLLASPRYGERWGRRWMDLARYADTNGYEKDRQRNIWPWRDWVVRSLNADMPFDQFTVEQIAGDLLPGSTPDQRIATGFHRNTMLNEEGGIDPLEFRFHAMTDRVATTGTTWLGLTLGCAQCHTHKYDPIPHREYYQVMAFLNNADEPDMDLPAADTEAQQIKRQEQTARLLAQLPKQFPLQDHTWETPKPLRVETTSGEKPRWLEDNSLLFSATVPDRDAYTIVLETDLEGVDGLRLEALTDDALPNKGPGRVKHGNFVLNEITITAAPRSSPDQIQTVKVVAARADVEQNGYPVVSAWDGNSETGWGVDAEGKKLNAPHSAIFSFERPVQFPGGTRFTVKLDHRVSQHLIGRPRLSLRLPKMDARPMEERRREAMEKQFAHWLEQQRSRVVSWTPLHPTKAVSNLPLLTVLPDESILASGDITKSDTYELTLDSKLSGVTAIRLEALPDDRLPNHGPGLSYYEGPKGDFFMGEFQVTAGGVPLRFSGATESYARNNFGSTASAALAVDGDPQTGWSTAGREGERHEAVFPLDSPLKENSILQVRMLFGRHYACSLGRFRISVTTHPSPKAQDLSPEVSQLLQVPESQWTASQRQQLLEQFLLTLPELAGIRKEIEQLRRRMTHPTTLVMRERPPENPRSTYVHKRGEFLQPTDLVQPGVLNSVAPFPEDLPRNRLGFARWLVSTNNPLTARVTVNRQWHAFFGRGLVSTTGDFGLQGETPSHPELLDWLAVEFMKQGWSLKKLHRLIVTSATYRQSSHADLERVSKDPQNRLLSRGPQVRLEAEIVRDVALRASGLLSEKMGGPGVYPPQPAGVTEVAYGNPSWPTSSGDDRHRRSLYTFIKRTAPFALYNTFDAPTGESCVARRDVSNTPLQALTLLNDVFFLEVSQAMGQSLALQEGTVESRIGQAFRRCVTRPPTDQDLDLLTRFYKTQHQRFASKELDAAAVAGDGRGDVVDRATWTVLARALLNLDETITKN